MIYTVIPGVLGGFIFAGSPFFLIAKQIPSTNILKEYLIVTGWGFIIFNVTTSGNVLNAAYPPFGFANVMLEVTACYLILVGLYCSALFQYQEIQRTTTSYQKILIRSIKIARQYRFCRNERTDLK